MWGLEIFTALLFLIVLFPFYIVLVNSAKDTAEIVTNPLGLPQNWNTLWNNIAQIWADPNVHYQSSFVATIVITVLSLALINLLDLDDLGIIFCQLHRVRVLLLIGPR